MGFFDTILYPLKWVVAWVLHLFHELFVFVGMDATSGWTWALSIVGLTVLMRILLIPLFFKQIKASRGLQMLQPEMQKIQKKYKGKNDPASRQQMQQEMMGLYQKHEIGRASCRERVEMWRGARAAENRSRSARAE